MKKNSSIQMLDAQPVDDIRTIDGQTIEDLLAVVQKTNPDADMALLRRAYTYAKEAHAGQLRKSGDPYIIHPLATAYMLAEIGLDDATIAAALLHDVPEDTERTLKDVKKEFGREIAFLVEGITKLGTLKYRGEDRYVENLRHMFVAMAKDARVILVKFADRINNLRTLDALPKEKQYRIALESMEIYAPIANRLGMGEMKGMLEDLAFPYVYDDEYQWVTKKIVPRFREKQAFVDDFRNYIEREFQRRNVPFISIHGRAKHYYSLHQKLLLHNKDISKIYDLIALRIIVDNVARCYETLGIIHELCRPLKGRIKDYISNPKPNGYQSLHTTVFPPQQLSTCEIHGKKCEIHGEIIEIQIRTLDMHYEAEYGIAAHWRYKETEGGKRKLDHKIGWMQQIIDLQKDVKDRKQLLESLKIDVFQNYIFVFTPRGDVIELPEGSTPVDFAYKIHTDLGNKCSGSRINDQIASLNTELNNGDIVEVFTDPHRKGPSPDWLSFVKTNTARHAIRSYHNKKQRRLLKLTT